MALNYDFDMVPGTPGLFADVALTGAPQITARFRDPQTVAALKRAPQPMQDYLHASCFGSDTHHSGAPAGRYPLADEAARIAVIVAEDNCPAATSTLTSATSAALSAALVRIAV